MTEEAIEKEATLFDIPQKDRQKQPDYRRKERSEKMKL